ncbi:methyltransferase family protein [Streptomyces sp. 840.1]|uniref:acetylserotonin O-methyltransferase n=1 Tax=Streptomyces sp. 840.1 TaxID=2485152 RepID=UPI000F9AA6E4|nr:acetylserotonin O-methyltransferase [Streptomyces sp. 840.1]ROQ69505.1 methyltransferase family protein [Streptomyces sp. 840.1]
MPEPEAPALDGLLRIAGGMWASQTLCGAVDLGLFGFLSAEKGASAAEVAEGLGIAGRPSEILLTACAALGLLVRDDAPGADARYVNTPTAEEYLVRGGPRYFGDYIDMLRSHTTPGWLRVTEAIRSDSPSRWDPDQQERIFDAGNRASTFWDGLRPLSSMTAGVLADAVDFSTAPRLLDVGGGGGAFVIELCRRYPHLAATVYDLPHVCAYTAGKIADAGLSARIGTHPGDFFEDPELPTGHDTILLSMIMHDWGEARNRELLAKCYRALPGGGRLVISELLVNDEKTGPLDAALMSMNMLVGTWGRNYTAAEYSEWLRAAGFDEVHTVRFSAPGANGAVLARKP